MFYIVFSLEWKNFLYSVMFDAKEVLLLYFRPGIICLFVCFVIALCPLTPKHIRGGWSHYTDTSKLADGNGAQNMVTVQSGFRTRDFTITDPTLLPTVLTVPTLFFVNTLLQ
jgi:hypothetical protein